VPLQLLVDAVVKANEHALRHGLRLLPSYTVNGEKLWAITEADRYLIGA
jgi:hypothetical protein